MRCAMGRYDWDAAGIQAIRKHALFLEEKGYVFRIVAGAVHYESADISISAHSGHRDENANVLITYIEQNETFPLNRFKSRLFSGAPVMPDESVARVNILFQFLEEHFLAFTSLEQCIAFERKIDQEAPRGTSWLESLIQRR